MRQLVSVVRTVILFLVGMCAFAASSSGARPDNEPDPRSRSTLTGKNLTGQTNQSASLEGSSSNTANKDNESRGRLEELGLTQIREEFSRLSRTVRRNFPEPLLESITNALKKLESAAKAKKFRDVKNCLTKNKWRVLVKAPDFPWDFNTIRSLMYGHWLKAYESPVQAFEYMKVQLVFPEDMRKISSKLLWWLDYVKKYRNLNDVYTVPTATSSTASSYGLFGNEKLFTFLVDEYNSQTAGKDMSLAVVSPETTLFDSRQQVVLLFELLRHEPTMTKVANDMQLYLVSNPDTQSLVFDAWLQLQVSPQTIFALLRVKKELRRVGESKPVDKFILWLNYLKLYWTRVDHNSVQNYFDYSAFIRLLIAKSWPVRVSTVLGSEPLRHVLQDVPQTGIGNLADNLMVMWASWIWLRVGVTPQRSFSILSPSREFKLNDPAFLHEISYIDLYRTRNPFTNEEVYNMLSPTHSYETIVGLFRWLLSYSWLQDIANGMLDYITDPSTVINVAEMTPAKYWQILLPEGVVDAKDNALLTRWFEYATEYFRSENNGSVQPANSAVYKLLQENVPDSQYADVLKAFKRHQHKRKRGQADLLEALERDQHKRKRGQSSGQEGLHPQTET